MIKVLIAVAAEAAFARGDLDPLSPVVLTAADRTPGPVGFSLFEDDASVSARDLVSAMLTISDNVAADSLLGLVGLARCNEMAIELVSTAIVSDLNTMIDSIAHEAGFADWTTMTRWSEADRTADERERVRVRVAEAAALDPVQATRTTARDMCRLLRLIWEDRAGPATACARVRLHLSRQLTRHRLAAGFPFPTRVAAKSGGLLGVVRTPTKRRGTRRSQPRPPKASEDAVVSPADSAATQQRCAQDERSTAIRASEVSAVRPSAVIVVCARAARAWL